MIPGRREQILGYSSGDNAVVIRSAHLPGGPAPFGPLWHLKAFFLSLALSLAGVACLWFFGYAFWAMVEAIAYLTHADRGDSLFLKVLLRIPYLNGRWSSAVDGWPLDVAVLLSVLATAGLLYLGFDRLGALGNRAAAVLLLRKARRLLPRPLTKDRYFVEIRSGSAAISLPSDVGWLFLYPDRLEFVGDETQVAVARVACAEVTLRRPLWGLNGAWVRVALPSGGILLVLPRDDIRRTSDSSRLAPGLRTHIAGE